MQDRRDLVHKQNLLFDETLARHFGGYGKSHYFKKSGSKIGEHAVLAERCVFIFFRYEHHGNGIRRMRRKRGTVGIQHFVGVAVICREQSRTAHGKNFIENFFHAFVYRVYGLYRRGNDARMSYHIAVGKV